MTGYKTFIVSLLLVIFGALETFDFTSFLGDQTSGIVVGIIGVITFALRTLTKTPIFKKDV